MHPHHCTPTQLDPLSCTQQPGPTHPGSDRGHPSPAKVNRPGSNQGSGCSQASSFFWPVGMLSLSPYAAPNSDRWTPNTVCFHLEWPLKADGRSQRAGSEALDSPSGSAQCHRHSVTDKETLQAAVAFPSPTTHHLGGTRGQQAPSSRPEVDTWPK